MTRIYDRDWNEIAEPKLIWADRVAISFFLLTGGLGGIVYALWGDPGAFALFEQIFAGLTAALWFAGRILDFLITGRIR